MEIRIFFSIRRKTLIWDYLCAEFIASATQEKFQKSVLVDNWGCDLVAEGFLEEETFKLGGRMGITKAKSRKGIPSSLAGWAPPRERVQLGLREGQGLTGRV